MAIDLGLYSPTLARNAVSTVIGSSRYCGLGILQLVKRVDRGVERA